MRTTQQLSITLPNEMAALVKEKVHSGRYASESEVIRDGLRALIAREFDLEDWLKTEVVAACEELELDPSSALTVEQVKANLTAEYKKFR